MKRILFLICMIALALGACKKNQLGGKATIQGKVYHHTKLIPYTSVFIKFNATEFPSADTTAYDTKVRADVNGNYSIKCYKGNYYLYGVGYDDQLKGLVRGGLAVHVRNGEVVNIDLAVTE